MVEIKSLRSAIEEINNFLKSSKRDVFYNFGDGFTLKLKKRIQKGNPFLEIHTGGYDDTLPAEEGLDWVKWHLYDLQANSVII